MIYLKRFRLTSPFAEEDFLDRFNRTCFDSYYPFMMFPEMGLNEVEFSDITIFCGSNGSGKSTLLNIMAEKLQVARESVYNKTYFFDPYVSKCGYDFSLQDAVKKHDVMMKSKIITSDDVFNHILNVRHKNEDIDFKRNVIFEKKASLEWEGPRSINFDNPESIRAYTDYSRMRRQSASRFVRENIGYSERTYSNGENGFKYFTDAIVPGGLYFLDEPENSLSAEMQLELVMYLQNMARFYECQFVLSSHSPFILSLPYAKIYNMDSCPVGTCRWTELPNVRIYYDFFMEHKNEFE